MMLSPQCVVKVCGNAVQIGDLCFDCRREYCATPDDDDPDNETVADKVQTDLMMARYWRESPIKYIEKHRVLTRAR